MIIRTPMMYKRPNDMVLDDHCQELTEDAPYFFDLVVNDVTGSNRDFHSTSIPSHWHREMEAFILLEGKARMGVDDRVFDICAGDAWFINSGVLHSFDFTRGSVQYRSFLFDSSIVAGAPGSVFDSVYVRPLIEKGPAVLKFSIGPEDRPFFQDFQKVFMACRDQPPAYEFQVREALSHMVLMARWKGQIEPARKITAVQENRVKDMIRFMDAHLREPVTLQDIADHVNICTRACQKAFQRYLHCSPMEYLQRRRIFYAAQRLALTDEPVTAIALDCGFSSPSYFSKQFRAQTGSSPVEYRTAVQQALGGSGAPPAA